MRLTSQKQKIKQIDVIPYQPYWPRQFESEAALIKQILGKHCLAVHHIGSTAVPGLCAKDIIDILCVIDDLTSAHMLQNIVYKSKGEYNIPLRSYYTKEKIHLHVVEADHGFIPLNLKFRDYLRTHEEARLEYAHLKETLLNDPTSYERQENSFSGYNLGKDYFIKDILDKANVKDLIVNFCMHRREWKEYHRIRKEQIFDLTDIEYDPHHPTITDPNHYHFVLYQGTRIIGVAHIEFLSAEECVLRPFAMDTPYQHQGLGTQFLKIIEKWLRYQGKKIIRLHANPPAISFYKQLDYVLMSFPNKEQCIIGDSVEMGKKLF